MYRLTALFLIALWQLSAYASTTTDEQLIKRAVLDYIESQQKVQPEMMENAIDEKLAKHTYWRDKKGKEFVMETSFDTMVWVAENDNKQGDKFPTNPHIDIKIFDIDNRAASVKLTVDDWIDYMHLYKTENGQWKIINVLWQYHDESKHASKNQ